ncbi:nucleoporin Nup188 [Periplaneta americana]|uniref:nucleoporin Nup188 n=1 Tax=Periplaneta americana TaxID=6978 RepID=UPI0037E8B860
MELKGDIIYSKALWVTISGTNTNALEDVVSHELQRAHDQLLNGLNHFHDPNKESEAEFKTKVSDSVYKFIMRLKRFLGLDINQAWDFMCNYLLYEFRGAEEGLQEFIGSETRTTVLLSDIWLFYWSERLFLLKCVNVLLTFHDDKGHPYQELFANILSPEEQPKFCDSLISQLEKLVSLDYPTPETHGSLMSDQFQNLWVMAILREELELVQNLLLYVDSCDLQADSFLKLFKIILQHNFGQDHLFGVLLNESHADIIKKISNMEVMLVLRALQVLGETGRMWDETHYVKLEALMLRLGSRPEHGPINMAWMLINFIGPNGEELFDSYRRFGELALKADCFLYLERILRHKMFKEVARFSNIAFRAVYQMLFVITSKFEQERLDGIEGIYNVTAAVLMHSDNITEFFEKPHDQGIYVLFQEAAHHFPEYFLVFSRIVECLSACGPKYINELMDYLSALPAFSEVLEPRVLTTQMVESPPGEWQLTSPHQPMPLVSFVIAPGTKGVFNEDDPSSIVWKCKFNFFYAVHNEMLLLISQAQNTVGDVGSTTMKNVISALKCLTNLLNSKCKISDEMIAPLETVFVVADRFCQLSNPPSLLLAACLDCMMALLDFFPEDVCTRISKLQFLPGLYYYNPTLMECIRAEHINLFMLGTLVVTQERSCGTYPLLKTYLHFIHRLMKPTSEMEDMNSSTALIDEDAVQSRIRLVLPGVVFMLRDVFPNYMFWRYVDEGDREVIALSCMQMIHQLLNLNLSKEPLTDTSRPICILYRACLYSLLFLDAGAALLRIVGSGDHYIQALMEQQVSWSAGRGLTFIRVVQLALSILNRLMILKESIKEEDKPCPLELSIYTQPSQKHGLKIVLVVANYIYHCFNPNLPPLAMKLLRRFAMDMPKALMSCMGMKPDVVRHTFVARLNSEVESVALKVALLELVTSCVEHQPALADAFLNVHHPAESKRMFQKKQKKTDEQGGCLIFACDVLSSMREDPSVATGPLYQAVMNLIHALWIGHKEFVLNFLRSRSDFWDCFCAPLFQKPSLNAQGYSQVLDILSLELFWYSGKVDTKLQANLKTFFNDDNYLKIWSKFIAESLTRKDQMTQSAEDERYLQAISLVTAWKDFLIVALKHLPFELTAEQKYFLADNAREALIQELEDMGSMKSIVLLAELCLILTTKWGRDSIRDEKLTLKQLHKILYHVSLSYDAFHMRAKEASLSMALRLVHLLRHEIREDSVTADCLMQASCQVVGIEVYNLPCIPGQDKTSSGHMTCTLSLCLMQKLLNILAWSEGWQDNFRKCNVVSKVLAAVGHILRRPEQFDFAVTLMNVLLVLSQTEFAQSMIHSGVMQHLWMQLLPPASEMSEQASTTAGPKHWTEHKWPQVYKPALEMLTVLLQSQKHLFLDEVITFVGIHEEHIIASILAVRHSLDKWPLDLAVTALTLIRELSHFKYTWRLSHEKSMFTIMKAVMVCLSSCVSYLIHPRLLKIMVERPPIASSQHLKAMTTEDPEISPHLISIQNRLLDIVCLCMATLVPYSPNVVNLLTDFRECEVEWEPLVEITFTAPALSFSRPSPTMSQEVLPSLTFGTLISFANLCTSALGKASRTPSPGVGRFVTCPLAGGVSIASGLSATWVSNMDKYRITMGLELSLALVASQGIMHLMDHRLCLWEKQLIKREIGAEMALFLEYAKRNLRSVRDGTESSRSVAGDGYSWGRFPGSAAAMAHSKRSYSSLFTDDRRPPVVRRLWPGTSPKKDETSKTAGSEQESIKLGTSFRIPEASWQTIQQADDLEEEGKSGAEKEKSSAADETPKTKAEPTSSKRTWAASTASAASKGAIPKTVKSPVPLRTDECVASVTSQFDYSEDYFRLMAHIFNCIFR